MYKDPVTDHGKMSRKGRMTLELDSSGHYITRTEGTGDPEKVTRQCYSTTLPTHMCVINKLVKDMSIVLNEDVVL